MLNLPVRARVEWRDPRLQGASWVLVSAALVALWFLPSSLTINDEYYYAGQAYVLSHGRVAAQSGDPLRLSFESAAEAFRYPVPWPLLLALGRAVSFRAMYVLALIVHLLGAAALARMLVRRDLPSAAVAVYVFHPLFWIYARTLMSDVPATAALLIAMDAWENRTSGVTVGALGFAGAVRVTGLLPVSGLALALGRSFWPREGLLTGLSLAAFWLLQGSVNVALGGSWFASPYAVDQAKFISSDAWLENLLLYTSGLALLPPFSLLLALWRRRELERWAVIAPIVVLAFLPVASHDVSARWLETLVGGQRYVMAAHAALLAATARVWARPALFARAPWVCVVGGLCGAIGALMVGRLEQRHLPAIQVVRACAPSVIAYDDYANRIAGSVAASRYEAIEWPTAPDARWDVLILAPGFQTNRPGYESSWEEGGPPQIAHARCGRVGSYAIYDFRGRCPAFDDPCQP